MKQLFAFLVLLVPAICFAQEHSILGINVAEQELKRALTEKSNNPQVLKRVIKDKQMAKEVAEPVLFKIYGKEQIVSERPYEVYLINGYWVINGTLPKHSLGGGFIIVLDSKDSHILRLSHYK